MHIYTWRPVEFSRAYSQVPEYRIAALLKYRDVIVSRLNSFFIHSSETINFQSYMKPMMSTVWEI